MSFRADEADLSKCVRCGLCLQSCPTYVETRLETEGPRGRLYLMRAMAEGVVSPTAGAIGHLDLCLQCRNCEAVCPSGVPYGRVMEQARAEVLRSGRAPLSWRLRSLFLRHVIGRPAGVRAFATMLRLARVSGLLTASERLPFLGPRATLAPRVASRPFSGSGLLARAEGEIRARVAVLVGCIMPYTNPGVHRAAVAVLARNGCEVVAPAGQVCCGALHAHNGDLAFARRLARRNVDAFLDSGVDAVVVDSAGCGAAMKEYGHLLRDDAVYAERAARVSRSVFDVSEFLASLPFEPPSGRLEGRVTYQDSCHLAHAQRVTAPPRQVLASIPGLELIEMAQPDRCCGSAGVYALTQPEMSLRLLDGKMSDVASTHADYIATSNPGCIAQLEAGVRRAGLKSRVVHVVELLARSYGL